MAEKNKKDTRFKESNNFWTMRSRHGRDKQYTPELLFKKAKAYFRWCQKNPLKEEQIVKYRDSFERVEVSKLRPFTISGLCNHLDIVVQTFDNYGKLDPEKDSDATDYLEVVTRIRQVIYTQKFEGAASGFFQQNIIARDLGLADNKKITKEVIKPSKYKVVRKRKKNPSGNTGPQ